jgi:hypothetical protein
MKKIYICGNCGLHSTKPFGPDNAKCPNCIPRGAQSNIPPPTWPKIKKPADTLHIERNGKG